MQQSETYNQELRAIFATRARESFASARRCLAAARMARRGGDPLRARKWLWCVKVLRVAAAGWRDRAQGIAP